MWKYEDGLWKEDSLPFLNLVTTRAQGNMRDAAARKAFLEKAGLAPERLVTAKQVHGKKVAAAGRKDAGSELDSTDGLITDEPGLALAVFTADCLPVFLAAGGAKKAAGVVHAGWRGLDAGIIAEAVERLRKDFGIQPGDLSAAIGPHIRECCYETGPELKERFGIRSSATNLDLSQIAVKQLRGAGVENISLSGCCTRHEGGMFFSYRKDRTGGRIMSLIRI